jgi:MYXO-CTERM domain-containing protein
MFRRVRASLAIALLSSCSVARAETVGSTSSAITGGEADTSHPAVLATGHQVGAGMFCSGYLITPDLVLTAHHCTANPASLPSAACTPDALMPPSLPANEMMVAPGPSIMNAPASYPVAKVHDVPDFATKTLCGNDLAVLELAKPVSGVDPISLRLDAPPALGETLTLLGYGQTSTTDPNSIGVLYGFAGATVDHIGYEETAVGVYAAEGEFSVDQGPCAGDSGGPALDASGRSVGVMSRGNKATCAHMVYSGVDAHADWLRSLALESAQRLGIAPPDWAAGGAGGAGGGAGAAGAAGSAGSAPSAGTGGATAPDGDPGSSGGCTLAPGAAPTPNPWIAALVLAAALRRRKRPRG